MSGCFRQPGMEHAGVRAHCWIGIPHKKGCTAYVGQPWKTLRFGEHLHLFNFGPYAHWATCRQSTCENRFLSCAGRVESKITLVKFHIVSNLFNLI